MANPTDEELRKKLAVLRTKTVERENRELATKKIKEILRAVGPIRAREVHMLMEDQGFSKSLSRGCIARMWDNGIVDVSVEQLIILKEKK